MSKQAKKTGFTLVELLVTIAVMGVLAAIAVPSMNRDIAQSKLKDAIALTKNSLEQARADALVYQTPIVNFVGKATGDTKTTISSIRSQNGVLVENTRPTIFDDNIVVTKENGMTDYLVFTQNKRAYTNSKKTITESDFNGTPMPAFSENSPQGYGFCHRQLPGTKYIVTVDALSNVRVVEKAGDCK